MTFSIGEKIGVGKKVSTIAMLGPLLAMPSGQGLNMTLLAILKVNGANWLLVLEKNWSCGKMFLLLTRYHYWLDNISTSPYINQKPRDIFWGAQFRKMTFAGDDNMPCNSTSQSREVFGRPLLGAFKLWEFASYNHQACQYHAIMQQGSSTRQYTYIQYVYICIYIYV